MSFSLWGPICNLKHTTREARELSPLTRRTNWTNLIVMKTVNVHEAKTNFSSLLARVEASKERIVICRNGEPIADLVPHQRKDRTSAHATLRRITIGYNPVETLSDDEWPQSSR